jgi:hypothetical protein
VFRDDFEDGDLEGWRQIAPPGGPVLWKVVDGTLEISKPGTQSTGLTTGESYWSDYTIEFDVMPLEHHGEGDIHVIARSQDIQQLFVFNVGDFCEPDGICVQRVPGGDITAQAPSELLKLNEWNHVKLEAKGSEFTFWVNDQKVLSYQDNAAKSGAVGVGITNYTARFDNFVISGPDVPDVTPPTWKEEAQPVEVKGKLVTTWAKIKQSR